MTATRESDQLHIYLLAGVKTSSSIFVECIRRLEEKFCRDGKSAEISTVFPYGDMSRNLLRQVFEVKSDLSNRSKAKRIGGKLAYSQIKQKLPEQCNRVLLIGHSGGGAAAYQAACLLDKEKHDMDIRIVQIGSPRMPILPQMKRKVSYFHAIDQTGKAIDPICRIGSWGGWGSETGVRPLWNASKYSPGHVEGIATMGGHADYFRHEPPFFDSNNICNLEKMMDRVYDWLKGWL